MPKALKDWQAFKDLTKKIEDFNLVCPLLERMTDPAMKERHWKRIEEITDHHFDFESENFQLRHVMEAPLLENIEDIEVGVAIVSCDTHYNLTNHIGCVYRSCKGERH